MTVELLLSREHDFEAWTRPKINQLSQRLKPRIEAKFPIPSIKPRKPRCHKIDYKIQMKGRKHPAIRKEISFKITNSQMKTCLLRQLHTEESSALKLTGVALFYSSLLENVVKENPLLRTQNQDQVQCVNCPLCKSQIQTDDLVTKMQKNVEYLVKYASNSVHSKQKQKLIQKLNPHQCVSGGIGCAYQYLSTSEYLNAELQRWTFELPFSLERRNKWMSQALGLREVQQGQREAVRLLKIQFLKKRSCGICNNTIVSGALTKILGLIDQTLSTIVC